MLSRVHRNESVKYYVLFGWKDWIIYYVFIQMLLSVWYAWFVLWAIFGAGERGLIGWLNSEFPLSFKTIDECIRMNIPRCVDPDNHAFWAIVPFFCGQDIICRCVFCRQFNLISFIKQGIEKRVRVKIIIWKSSLVAVWFIIA